MGNYKVVSGSSPFELTDKVNVLLETGEWFINGSHQVVILRQQNRYRGDQMIDTYNEIEYSQTLIKK
jgi:hypothetical protein